MVQSFKDLIVWQKSMDLVKEIYCICQSLPLEERFALSLQMRRAAVSIPSNIAEGQQRKSTKGFVNFLSIARGSNAELQTQLYLCQSLKFLRIHQVENALKLTDEIGKMLNALIERLSENDMTNH